MSSRIFTGLTCAAILLGWPAVAQNSSPRAAPTGDIALRDAIETALLGSPELSVYSWDLRAADARVIQAGLRTNPELSLELENVRVSSGPERTTRTTSLGSSIASPVPTAGWTYEREQGARSGFAESEITLSISQAVELGGKRAKRIASAQKSKSLAAWDYERARAGVIADTAAAFTEVLLGQERLALQDELVRLAGDVARSIGLRVDAGKVSPLEKSRADIALAMARVGRERLARELSIARARLAASWGSENAVFVKAIGVLDDLAPVPDAKALLDEIEANPDVARWADEMSLRDANVRLARSQRIPDATFEFGFRSTGVEARSGPGFAASTDGGFGFSHSNADDGDDRDESLVIGISVPLPLFNRNQGTIAEAEYLASKSGAERRAVEVRVIAQLTQACENASGAREEATAIGEQVLSRATESLEKTRIGYEQGKFGYLDVLDAQRALFDSRSDYLDALARYHLATIEIEQLTGRALRQWKADGGPATEKVNE